MSQRIGRPTLSAVIASVIAAGQFPRGVVINWKLFRYFISAFSIPAAHRYCLNDRGNAVRWSVSRRSWECTGSKKEQSRMQFTNWNEFAGKTGEFLRSFLQKCGNRTVTGNFRNCIVSASSARAPIIYAATASWKLKRLAERRTAATGESSSPWNSLGISALADNSYRTFERELEITSSWIEIHRVHLYISTKIRLII